MSLGTVCTTLRGTTWNSWKRISSFRASWCSWPGGEQRGGGLAVGAVKRLVPLLCCLLLLWYWWQCYRLMAFGDGFLSQRPSPPHIAVVVPLGSSVADASYTVTGPPTISPAFIDRVLFAYGSPAKGTGQTLYALGVESGIDPVYAL